MNLSRKRILAHSDGRGVADQLRARGDPRRSQAADASHRAHPVLPLGGGRRRQGHARHDPPAPVHQGRARLHHHAGRKPRRARAHDRVRRGGAEAPRPAVPHHPPVHRRHGLCLAEDLRHRGVAAGREHLPRNLLVLGVRRLPGAAHERALQAEGRQGHALRAHAERLRPRGRAHAHRRARELPAGRRLGRHSRGAAPLHGRPRQRIGRRRPPDAHPRHQRRRHRTREGMDASCRRRIAEEMSCAIAESPTCGSSPRRRTSRAPRTR